MEIKAMFGTPCRDVEYTAECILCDEPVKGVIKNVRPGECVLPSPKVCDSCKSLWKLLQDKHIKTADKIIRVSYPKEEVINSNEKDS
jgi:flagellar biosynthesis regulator FlbT